MHDGWEERICNLCSSGNKTVRQSTESKKNSNPNLDPRLMATTETSRVVITNIKKSNCKGLHVPKHNYLYLYLIYSTAISYLSQPLKPSLLAASINSASCSIDLSYPGASLSIVWIRARGSVPILVSMPLMNWYVVSFEINMKKGKEKGP